MKKLLIFIICFPLCVFAQTPPPAPASAQDVIDGIATYKFVSPYALSQSSLAGGGAAVSNRVIAAVPANFYTNSTPHYLIGYARLGISGVGTMQCSVTNSANTRFFDYTEDALSVSATSNTIAFTVPPYGWYKFAGQTTVLTEGNQALFYYATNGSVSFATTAGTVTDGATQTGLAAGSYAVGGWSTNIIYVAKNGSDSTGSGSYLKPFLTLTNAKQQAVIGQTIHVAPGLYTNQNNLSKNGVNWHYEAGATNLYIQTTTNDAGWGIYDDRTVSGGCEMTLSGQGTFIWIGVSNVTAFYDQVSDDSTFNFNPNSVGCIVQTNSLSNLSLEAKLVSGSGWTGYSPYTLWLQRGLAKIVVETVTNITRGANYSILSGLFSSTSTGVFTSIGNISLHCKTLEGENYAWFWSSSGGTTNNTYIKADKIFGNLYGDVAQSPTNLSFGWVTADELDSSDSHGVGVPISAYGSGRWYFDIKKIKAYTGRAVIDTVASGASTNAQVWVTAQKIESDTKFVDANCGEVWISCQDWKFTGSSLLNGITSTAGAVVYPQYGISIKTNIAAATSTLLVNLVPPMPGTNYSPRASFGFSGVTNHWFTSLNRSNVTLNIQTGGSAGGAVYIEAKQNVQ